MFESPCASRVPHPAHLLDTEDGVYGGTTLRERCPGVPVQGVRWRDDALYFKRAFALAASDRYRRPELDPVTGEPGWVLHERESLLEAVNRLRSRRNLPPMTAADVAAAETSAKGHIDYVTKLSYRLADLAAAEPNPGTDAAPNETGESATTC